jgi:hypothetical protein
MRLRTLLVSALCLCLGTAGARASDPQATAGRSTGNTETQVAEAKPATPPAPRAPIQVALAGAEKRKLVEGKASAASPGVVLWTAPPDRMLNIQLMTEGNSASLVVFQPGEDEPTPGAGPKDGAIRWIGAASRAGELRLEVHTKAAGEVSFKLGVELAALDSDQSK